MNLLKTKIGRLVAFGAMYLAEGLPQGFYAVSLLNEFTRAGFDEKSIGQFSAAVGLPWAFKWAMGPFVDNLFIKKFGARKQWIIFAQLGMLATLLAAFFQLPTMVDGQIVGLAGFTALMVVHNCFAATQDVAIDALACSTLSKPERGLANGVMFGAATAGMALGGAAVLFFKNQGLAFTTAIWLVPVLLLAVMLLVIFLVGEKSARQELEEGQLAGRDLDESGEVSIGEQLKSYLVTVFKTFCTTRRGFLGLIISLLPFGGMAMSMTVSTILTPKLGIDDGEIALMGLVGTLIFVPCCMAGGWLSDKFDRRKILAICCTLTLAPSLWMGYQLHRAGWDYMPEPIATEEAAADEAIVENSSEAEPSRAGDKAADGAEAPTAAPAKAADKEWARNESLIRSWWIASIVFSVFFGLYYGTKSAFFMDIVNPAIAGTHFTAMMAMNNLVLSYTYWWQGKALASSAEGGWGLTNLNIFIIDAILGVLFLAVIPWIKPNQIKLDDLD